MREYDGLPIELRSWLASAVLPWRPASVRRAYGKALTRTREPELALQELDALQARLIAKDAAQIWGKYYPEALD